jgi:hypothetical protein
LLIKNKIKTMKPKIFSSSSFHNLIILAMKLAKVSYATTSSSRLPQTWVISLGEVSRKRTLGVSRFIADELYLAPQVCFHLHDEPKRNNCMKLNPFRYENGSNSTQQIMSATIHYLNFIQKLNNIRNSLPFNLRKTMKTKFE